MKCTSLLSSQTHFAWFHSHRLQWRSPSRTIVPSLVNSADPEVINSHTQSFWSFTESTNNSSSHNSSLLWLRESGRNGSALMNYQSSLKHETRVVSLRKFIVNDRHPSSSQPQQHLGISLAEMRNLPVWQFRLDLQPAMGDIFEQWTSFAYFIWCHIVLGKDDRSLAIRLCTLVLKSDKVLELITPKWTSVTCNRTHYHWFNNCVFT